MRFIDEWNEEELMAVEVVVMKYFHHRPLLNRQGEYVYIDPRGMEERLGLAYISSGAFALLTLDTNEHLFHPEFNHHYYSYAAINEDGIICIVLEDKKGQEIVEEIENLY